MSGRSLAMLLAVLALSVSIARAQAPAAALPEQLTLPVLLRLVAERSPRLAAEQVAIDAAEADRITASALPNPTLSYGRYRPAGGGNTLFDGSRQEQSTVDIPLLIAGQRGARMEAAEQGLLATRARVGLAGNDLALRAAELFVGLQAAQEKVGVLQESLAEIERASEVISGRLASGVASRYDLARVELELAAVNVRMDDARAERVNQAAGLAALMGAPGWRPGAIGTPVPAGFPADAATWRAQLVAGNLQVQAARREEDAAQAAVTRAERERWPVPVLNLGRTWTSDPFGAANFVGVTTEVPLMDSRRGPLAKAKADVEAARRRREAIESEAGVELLRLLDSLTQRRTALESFERKVGARIPALKQMAEDAYRLGRGSILELIDAGRARLDARLTNVDLRAAIVQQELRVKALTGRLVDY
jgi:cobalt-zinc-cadmium efflux system outer membrane protein